MLAIIIIINIIFNSQALHILIIELLLILHAHFHIDLLTSILILLNSPSPNSNFLNLGLLCDLSTLSFSELQRKLILSRNNTSLYDISSALCT